MHPRITALRLKFKDVSAGDLPASLALDAMAGIGIPAIAIVAGTAFGGMADSWGLAWYAMCAVVLATAVFMLKKIYKRRFPEWSHKMVGKRLNLSQLQDVQVDVVLEEIPELTTVSVANRIIDDMQNSIVRRAAGSEDR